MRKIIRRIGILLPLAIMIIAFSGISVRAAAITRSQVLGTWDGEYDGDWYSGSQLVYVKRHVTFVFNSCDTNGNIQGGLYLAAIPGKDYQFTGSYNITGKVNFSTGLVNIYPGSWIKTISNFNKSNFQGTFQIGTKTLSGYRYIGSFSTFYKFNVKKISTNTKANKITYVSLSLTSKSLKAGNSFTLQYTVSPNTITPSSVKWTSSNTSVATVNSAGKVTGVGAGTCKITCKATYNGSSKSASCTVKVTGSSKVAVTGVVTDAATGTVLGSATVKARSGYNNKTGTVVAKTKSDSSGKFSLDLSKGKFTLDISKSGYIQNYVNINVDGKNSKQDVSLPITKKIASSKYRIVLSWGAAPADLDLHVTGPQGSGRFHVFWNAKSQYNNGVYLAVLDVDDRNGYGPETITLDLSKGTGGTYHFYVHNYTNRTASSSTALAKSGARVEVYQGSSRLASYSVPNKAGLVWQVCDIVNGKLKKVNKMGYITYLESNGAGMEKQ